MVTFPDGSHRGLPPSGKDVLDTDKLMKNILSGSTGSPRTDKISRFNAPSVRPEPVEG
jgi:hypothetical protein